VRAARTLAWLSLAAIGLVAQQPHREKADPGIQWWAFQGPNASPLPCMVARTRGELEDRLTELGWSVLQGHAGIAWRDGKFAAIVTGPPRTQLGKPLRVEAKGDTALIHMSAALVMNTRIFVVEMGPTPLFRGCETTGP
jgi:hypothetical protein